jgi:hypothetical protein
VDLLKHIVISDALLVAFDDLVIPDTNASVAVLKEPVGVVTELLIGLHGDPPEVEGVTMVIVGEIGREGLGQVGPRCDAASREVVEPL